MTTARETIGRETGTGMGERQLATSERASVPFLAWLRSAKGFLLAVGLLLAFELGVARQRWWWTCAPSSPSAALEVVEQALIAPARRPIIVIMGSSRHRGGLLPRRMEERLSLPEGSILNLSIPMGTPFDALTLYRRNREKLSRARLLIVGLDDWDLNASLPLNDRDRRFATLRERLALYDRRQIPGLLLGWAWRTYDANGPIRFFFRDFILGGKRTPPVADEGRMNWERKPEVLVGPDDIEVTKDLDPFYWNYTPATGRLKQLDLLIQLAREDGVQVMALRLPMRASYTKLARARHGPAYASFLQALAGIRGARVQVYESGSDIGIPDRHFQDYGHLTRLGSEAMSDRLADLLRATYRDLARSGT